MNGARSIHALVRLLKSSTDPPSVPGPSKIEIARLAWSDSSFCAANKGEVIGEWILAQFGQATKTRRERDSSSDPALDARYWSLLGDLLANPPPTTTRPVKTWLLPSLNRIQLDTLVVELLASRSSQLISPARAALAVLWPLAEKKFSVDSLVECLDAVFDACSVWEHVDEDLGWICSTVIGAYRNALAYAGNKKKLHNSFLTGHLSSWLHICSLDTHSSTKQLQESVYAAGTDTLFSLDALKQPLDALFDALSSSPVSSLLLVLPGLFASFLSAIHRHRSTLFVTTTSPINGKEEGRKKGMEFLAKCWALIQNLPGTFIVERWRSIVGLFEIVEKERLFVARLTGSMHIEDKHGGEWALSDVRDEAVEMLENTVSSEENRTEKLVLFVQVLDVLVRIEYDLIGSVLERVLSTLIKIPLKVHDLVEAHSSGLLLHVLEYHSKTRTVHTYASVLLRAVVASCASLGSWTDTSLSTFPLSYHLPALARALRASLTPNQNNTLAITVLQAVEGTWKAVKDEDLDECVVKKRKRAQDTDERRSRMQARVQAFSFISHIAGIILSNLSSNAYVQGEEYSLESLWGDVGKLGWSIVWDCLGEGTLKADKHKVNVGDSRKRKHATETSSFPAHCCEVMASAALRLLYDVRARVSVLLGDGDKLEASDIETLLMAIQDDTSEPMLVLEIVRSLFWYMWYTHNHKSQTPIETRPVFSATLDILPTRILSQSEWSGASGDLTRDNLSLAVLYVLTNRWIEVLDALASPENLERFISILLAVPLDLLDGDTTSDETRLRDHTVITQRGILLILLRNAQFWELHNLRAAFLSFISRMTEPLSACDLPVPGTELPLPALANQTEFALACDVYGFLYYVPLEYFTRSVRTNLITRAMAADFQICAILANRWGAKSKRKKKVGSDPNRTEIVDDRISVEELNSWLRRLTFIRAFLQHMGQFLNTASNTTSLAFTTHLLSPPQTFSPSKALANVTLNLIEILVLGILHSREPEMATSMISTLKAAEPFSRPRSQEIWAHVVIQSSVLKLIERLVNEFDPASLMDGVKRSLEALLGNLESVVFPYVRPTKRNLNSTELVQFATAERIGVWSRILSLKRWLGISSGDASSTFGLKLAVSMMTGRNSVDVETCSNVLGLLFEELWCILDVSHRTHLDVLVGFYAANSGHQGSDQEKSVVDTCVAQAARRLSVQDFSYLLDVLVEGIGGGDRVDHRERLIHLGRILLHDAPQGTLKVVQNFISQCFSLFSDREEIYGGPSSLKIKCLEFIARHCSDRPVAIRAMDLGYVWSFLHKMLRGSSEHDVTTAFPVFRHTTTIISAFIRLRRDLVVHTLPHLGLILCRLMMLTRKIRPQLGAKQKAIVTDTFPTWLSASQPLSTEEARVLARLLTSLITKTVPRTHPSTPIETRKAESLAKPFAKHASYVLVAYVNAFNDPLCIMNAEMRRELEPGLFALCEMVGEYSRDALMVSALDSGGKTIVKSLWKDYEKQRYVGKG